MTAPQPLPEHLGGGDPNGERGPQGMAHGQAQRPIAVAVALQGGPPDAHPTEDEHSLPI